MDFIIDLFMELLPEFFAGKLSEKLQKPLQRIPWKGLRWTLQGLVILLGIILGIGLPLLVVVLIILFLKALGFHS